MTRLDKLIKLNKLEKEKRKNRLENKLQEHKMVKQKSYLIL